MQCKTRKAFKIIVALHIGNATSCCSNHNYHTSIELEKIKLVIVIIELFEEKNSLFFLHSNEILIEQQYIEQ